MAICLLFIPQTTVSLPRLFTPRLAKQNMEFQHIPSTALPPETDVISKIDVQGHTVWEKDCLCNPEQDLLLKSME